MNVTRGRAVVRQNRSMKQLLALALLASASFSETALSDDQSFARRVPENVGFFAEVRNSEDLLLQLIDPQLWVALADIAGQPARPEDTEDWKLRIRATIGMSPDEAVRRLFSRHVAFVGEGPGRSQDAAILCLPGGNLDDLLKQWNAVSSRNDGAQRFALPGGIGAAIRDPMLVFGDDTAGTSMFHRVVNLANTTTQKSLADDPAFGHLRRRITDDPDGLLFARLPVPTTNPATQPSTPGMLANSRNLLIGMYRRPPLVSMTLVGDASPNVERFEGDLREMVSALPERTLAVWSGHVDYPALFAGADQLPERNALRLFFQMQARSGTLSRFMQSLGTRTCVAVGAVSPRVRTIAAPPIPAIAVVIDVRNRAVAQDELAATMRASASTYNLLALKFGLPAPLSPVEPLAIGNATGELLDLSILLGDPPASTPLGELQVAWACDGDTLVIASHVDWLREILSARRRSEGRLESIVRLGERSVPGGVSPRTILVLQSGPIADLGQLWLSWLDEAYPETLTEAWWRNFQPNGNAVRLGITVTENAETNRLRVESVQSNGPSDGVLRPGDEIVGVNRHRFATTQPRSEVQTELHDRPNARWVELTVERDGVSGIRRVPVGFVDPIQLLRRAIAVGGLVQRVIYADDIEEGEGPRGFVTLEMRTSDVALYPFAISPGVTPVSSDPP